MSLFKLTVKPKKKKKNRKKRNHFHTKKKKSKHFKFTSIQFLFPLYSINQLINQIFFFFFFLKKKPHYFYFFIQIHFALLLNRQGKQRLSKFYDAYTLKERSKILKEIASLILSRYVCFFFFFNSFMFF